MCMQNRETRLYTFEGARGLSQLVLSTSRAGVATILRTIPPSLSSARLFRARFLHFRGNFVLASDHIYPRSLSNSSVLDTMQLRPQRLVIDLGRVYQSRKGPRLDAFSCINAFHREQGWSSDIFLARVRYVHRFRLFPRLVD